MATRVLIIDDDQKHRESLADVVDSFGYQADSAGNFEEAKKKIQESGPFHLVLLDYLFGPNQKTGLDAVGELRQFLPVEEVPILMMTGYASLDVAVRAVREGLSDFLIKPIDPEYLKHTLIKHLEKARLVKENQRLMKELQIKNEELARLNDLKSKFLSFCAHDLSNTVSSCTMANDLLQVNLGQTASPQIKRLLELLTDSLDQTQRLIGDLVDWAAIEKGKFHIDQAKTKVEDFLRAPIFSLIKQKGWAKGINFEMNCRVDPSAMMTMDAKRVLQVLTNLFENGLRYSPSGSSLAFTLEKDQAGQFFIFHVADSGEGIDPEEAPHLFESFYQGKDPKKQRGRLGLGLSIAKEIVEDHKGEIWVASAGVGKGTTFSFKIPIENSTPA
ncbi:MAG: response regulator [Elusimicrobia bacterium]|nr:response regulator [Elusimicrobiota bacterium]